jgi:hypothetical protein
MLLRAARKIRAHSLGNRSATKCYVVTPTRSGGRMHIGELLRHYPRVTLLDSLDESTALVEMTERDRVELTQQHPELAIEPNLTYHKLR